MEISCVILAGGSSSRMGMDKTFLLLNDKPLIKYPLNISKKFFSDVVISVKKWQKERLKKIVKNVKIVIDESNVYSPFVGIKRAIKHIIHDYIFLLSCDMPFIRETTINCIISKVRNDVDCIVYAWSSKKYEPFCGVYKKNVFYGCSVNDSLHSLIDRIENKILVPIGKQTNEFFNINTENDLILARRLSHFG